MKDFLFAIALLCSVASLHAEDPPATPPTVAPAILPPVEERYSSEVAKAEAIVAKAEAELVKARKAAGEVRLKAYRERLTDVTKSGDFDKAVAVKARIEQLEKEPDGPAEKSAKRPRPKDAVKFQGHHYVLIKEPATWHVAKRRCEEMGGHLVCIESAQELDFVLGITQSNNTEAWLGGFDEESEGDWKWVNGTPIAKAMLAQFRIDNHQASQHVLSAGASHNVEDNCAAYRRQFICEWDK